MLIRNEGKLACIMGDSLMDISNYLDRTPRAWHGSGSIYSDQSDGMSWDLGAGWSEAKRLAKTGWTTGAEELYTAVQAIQPEGTMAEQRYDYAGEFVDVPRFLGGAHDCMVRKGRTKAPKPTVHLIIHAGLSASVNAKAYAKYGAALASIVDRLEASGRRVELDYVIVVEPSWGGDKGIGLVGWNVKRAEDAMDFSAVSFSVVHPAAYRRFGFALFERLPAATHNYGAGLGMPGKFKPSYLSLINREGAVVLPGLPPSASGYDTAQMLAFAMKQVNDALGEEVLSAA